MKRKRKPKDTLYRLGIYDPCDDTEPIKFVGDVMKGSPRDRRDIQATIHHYNRWAAKRKDIRHCLAVFEVETVAVQPVEVTP